MLIKGTTFEELCEKSLIWFCIIIKIYVHKSNYSYVTTWHNLINVVFAIVFNVIFCYFSFVQKQFLVRNWTDVFISMCMHFLIVFVHDIDSFFLTLLYENPRYMLRPRLMCCWFDCKFPWMDRLKFGRNFFVVSIEIYR